MIRFEVKATQKAAVDRASNAAAGDPHGVNAQARKPKHDLSEEVSSSNTAQAPAFLALEPVAKTVPQKPRPKARRGSP